MKRSQLKQIIKAIIRESTGMEDLSAKLTNLDDRKDQETAKKAARDYLQKMKQNKSLTQPSTPVKSGQFNESLGFSQSTPFLVQTSFYGQYYEQWFNTEQQAIEHLKKVGNVGRIFEVKREIKYPGQNQSTLKPLKKQKK